MDYAFEGSVFVGGAVIQWLRDGLQFFRTAEESEALALTVKDSAGVFLVPAFVGLGAPYWDSYARGTMVGLTRGTTRAHITRAALESIAYQSAELLEAMQKDSKLELKELRVDGGASKNNLLMQTQADILGVPVVRPKVTETTALGAAYLAGLAVGYCDSIEQIASSGRPTVRSSRRSAPTSARANSRAGRKPSSVPAVGKRPDPPTVRLMATNITPNPARSRDQLLAALRRPEQWDLVVIGGGATGLGTALDAAARGYRTLLLEGADFAKGTSSRSTKLVHGGVRYLAQGNIKLVREALRERGLLKRNAPHLVHDMGFVIPSYKWWWKPFYGIGLTMYDLLAGKLGFGRCKVLSKEQALAHTPTLKKEGLLRRHPLSRRSIRRRAARGDAAANVLRPGRHGAQLRARHRVDQGRRQGRGRHGARRGNGRGISAALEGGRQRHGRFRGCRPPHGRTGRQGHALAQPGRARRGRPEDSTRAIPP